MNDRNPIPYPYGAFCTWHGPLSTAGSMPGGLPCCPHCNGVLMQLESEKIWWDSVKRYEDEGHPGYESLMRWSQGKCFKDVASCKKAFEEANP